MAFILRKIRKAKWYKHDNIPWLGEDELQADALADLITTDISLSVWYIEDDRSNLNQVVAALAATSDHISNLDFALLESRVLSDVGIKIIKTPGLSPDDNANILWHYDLAELSSTKLMRLAEMIRREAIKQRLSNREVEKLLREGLNSGRLNPQKLKDGVKGRILS